MRLSILPTIALLLPAAAAGQLPELATLPASHPACRAGMHLWAAGGSGQQLGSYGTQVLVSGESRVAPSAVEPATEPRSGEALFLAKAREWGGVGIELGESDGPVLGGDGRSPPTTPAEPVLGLRGRGDLAAGPLDLGFDVSLNESGARVRRLALAVRSRPITTLVGRLGLRTGPACDGSLVLGASERAGAWGLELRQGTPFQLPWIGSVRFGVQVGAMREGGQDNRWPAFHSMRIEVAPHPDWVVGLNRAAVFGGSGSTVDITPRTVALMFVGLTTVPGKDSRFENQVASVDVRTRTRIGSTPVLLTGEYGSEDSGWAFLHVPGFRVTTEARLGESWFGLESAYLAARRRTYPSWYRHYGMSWGWTDRGWLLGNPLGGEGVAAFGTWRKEGPSLALDLRLGIVDRGPENLLAPDLEGLGGHASARLVWLSDSWEGSVSASSDVAGATSSRIRVSIMRRLRTPG